MPFTPSIIYEKHKNICLIQKKFISHMTIARINCFRRDHLKARIHNYDETVRPQMLKKKDNLNYYNLIKELKNFWHKCTFKHIYNLHGFPIVCNAKDAIKTFKKT